MRQEFNTMLYSKNLSTESQLVSAVFPSGSTSRSKTSFHIILEKFNSNANYILASGITFLDSFTPQFFYTLFRKISSQAIKIYSMQCPKAGVAKLWHKFSK